MAKTPVWDAAFLKERERDAKEQAEQAQFEADWEQADATILIATLAESVSELAVQSG